MQIANCKLSIGLSAICNLHFRAPLVEWSCILQLPSVVRRRTFAKIPIAALCLALGTGTGSASRGDVLELANGGRVEGRLAKASDGNRTNVVIELAAGGTLVIPRSQIARVDSTSEAEAEYAELARTSADTVEAHWKLAQWCRERKLRPLAQKHLTRILELEPNHEQARALLGFRRNDGQWMTRDEVMASRGMVLYDGKYVTRQHVELLEKMKAAKVSDADWANHLERLRRWLTGRRQDRSAQALAEIQSIADPAAAEAIVQLLRREDQPELKRLWLEVASRLDHAAAVDALVDVSLLDPDPELRHQSLEYLIQSGRSGLITPYIRSLKDRDNELVNRAAAALGQIGDPQAMGPLIDALITKHRYKVEDGNPDQHAYTFSPQGGGFSFGGGGPKYVTETIRNPEVLAALVHLSGGTSFDYDQGQWRRWLAAQAKEQAVDIRRDE
jgi:hypothetical protein